MTDAHNHLQDKRFDGMREEVIEAMQKVGIFRCVVNGTRPADWHAVADLAKAHPNLIIPSFGLHPWYVADASDISDWMDRLIGYLDALPHSCIGECGLDRCIDGYDIELQIDVFTAQLELAAKRNCPITIHCVRAWGMMLKILESQPLPACGFILHSYGGSAELVPQLVKLGAYFSFSGSILYPKMQKAREVFRHIPADRLLIETDAPSMMPPEGVVTHSLTAGVNHPANLPSIEKQAAHFLDTSLITTNFKSLMAP